MRRLARISRAVLGSAGIALALALPAAGQETAVPAEPQVSLVADVVTYDEATGLVVAEGAVEVYYGARTLTAERIVYDAAADEIRAEGEIVLRDPDGDITVYGELAELDPDLREGLVLGAQMVMGRQAKLAAVEARRVGDRYNALAKAVYSPCNVCPEDPTPLWRIRARRVIHDEIENVIHYENATFDVLGVPVFWTPYFRHPDPTVERQSGFLVPSFESSSGFGVGMKLPYYWVIDDFSDATLEPFLTTEDGPVMIGEYRRRFVFGDLELGGSGMIGDYQGKDEFHGHLDALGRFETRTGIDYGFDIDLATDDDYLRRFEFSDDDWLESEVYLRDYRADAFFDLAGVFFQSLRERVDDGEVPFVLPDFAARFEFDDPLAGGEFALFADSATVIRPEGDDSARFSLGADWQREFILPVGLVLTPFAEARVDAFATDGKATFGDDTEFRLAPLAGVEARYPLINRTRPGVAHVLEPVAQLVLAPEDLNDGVPNEDSLLTEFDETGLFERDHLTGFDLVEEGPRLNVGLRYQRLAEDLDIHAVVGQVLRFEDADAFAAGSGLGGTRSDFVGAWSATWLPWFSVRQRLRVSEELDVNRHEAMAGLDFDRFELDLGYIFLDDGAELRARGFPAFEDGRPIDVPEEREEISAGAEVRLTDNWSVGTFVQHDLGRDELVEVGGGISYENECVAVDLGVENRFTDTEDAGSGLSVGLEVRLLTLGTEPEDRVRAAGVCG